jgi:hypothetical protein
VDAAKHVVRRCNEHAARSGRSPAPVARNALQAVTQRISAAAERANGKSTIAIWIAIASLLVSVFNPSPINSWLARHWPFWKGAAFRLFRPIYQVHFCKRSDL